MTINRLTGMRDDPIEQLREQLRSRENKKLYRRRLTLESPQQVHVSLAGGEYLAFCSNDYLGLANHPQLIAAVRSFRETKGIYLASIAAA